MKKMDAVAGFQLFVKCETRRLFPERPRSPHLEVSENAFLWGKQMTTVGCGCDTISLTRSMPH